MMCGRKKSQRRTNDPRVAVKSKLTGIGKVRNNLVTVKTALEEIEASATASVCTVLADEVP